MFANPLRWTNAPQPLCSLQPLPLSDFFVPKVISNTVPQALAVTLKFCDREDTREVSRNAKVFIQTPSSEGHCGKFLAFRPNKNWVSEKIW